MESDLETGSQSNKQDLITEDMEDFGDTGSIDDIKINWQSPESFWSPLKYFVIFSIGLFAGMAVIRGTKPG